MLLAFNWLTGRNWFVFYADKDTGTEKARRITQEGCHGWQSFSGGKQVDVGLARKLLMTELQAKRGKQKIVEERATEGVCLIDDCGRDAHKRGLCEKHRNQFYAAMQRMDADERIAFEQEMIREGLVLPAQAIWKYKVKNNPFRETA